MTNTETILEIVSTRLPKAGIDCLLIGGYAVNYYGYTRNTLDMDFMILGDHLESVKCVMTQAGFFNITIQDNVAFFNQPGSSFRVDFLRTDAGTMQALLKNAVVAKLRGHEIKVPSLRDLIAMKIFSLSGNTARRQGKDLPDIAYLVSLHDLDLETDVRPLCDKFGTDQAYALIRNQVEALRE